MAEEELECRISRLRGLISHAAEPKAMFLSKAGWLYKRGTSHRKWHKRWCSIASNDCNLRHSCHPNQEEDGSTVVMAGKVTSVVSIPDCIRRGKCEMHGFCMTDEHGKHRLLYCTTSMERDAWISCLSTIICNPQARIDDRYSIDWRHVIGSGTYADVVRGTDKESGEPVAVKVVSKSACRHYFSLMNKEVTVMHMIGKHPHLLGCREVFYSQDHIYIVTDYLEGGELYDKVAASYSKPVTPFTEAQASRVIRQVLVAVSHLHRIGVVHCDVKPSNLMSVSREEDSPIKLIDYNSAVFISELTEPGGTPEYMAPELISHREQPSQAGVDGGADMWAVGVVLYWLLCGYTPFRDTSVPAVMCNIERGCFRWPKGIKLSQDVKSIIGSLLRRDSAERPKAAELLNHPWINQSTAEPCTSLPMDTARTICIGELEKGLKMINLQASCPKPEDLFLTPKLAVRIPQFCRQASCEYADVSGCPAQPAQLADHPPFANLSLDLAACDGLEAEFSSMRDPLDSCMSMHGNISFGLEKSDSMDHESASSRVLIGDRSACKAATSPSLNREHKALQFLQF